MSTVAASATTVKTSVVLCIDGLYPLQYAMLSTTLLPWHSQGMVRSPPLYFDYNATAPLAEEVRAAMDPWLRPLACNPSSVHFLGQRAREAVEQARESVAELAGRSAADVVFTSGGTEADSLAIWSCLWPPSGHVVASAIEHPAVLETIGVLVEAGVELSMINVNRHGQVDLSDIAAALRPDTRCVSVMAANNEVGTIQPIPEIASLTTKSGVPFHCDAVQAAAWVDLRQHCSGTSLISLSGHKIGGPPGIGALVVRPDVRPAPFMRGGGQQDGHRGGTEPTPLIVGFGAACQRVSTRREAEADRVAALRDRLEQAIVSTVPGTRRNGPDKDRLPNTLHLSFRDCPGDALVARLDLGGLAASAGSACASGVPHDSYVLKAMGVDPKWRDGALRLSLGYDSTEQQVDRAATLVCESALAVRSATRGGEMNTAQTSS